MDYDATAIAVDYDRARALTPASLANWLTRLEAAIDAPPADVVDLGCGTGRFAAALAERFAARVLGVDPSASMLAEARAKTGSPQVRYLMGSAEAIPAFDGSADLVFLSMVFHHIADRDGAARECARVLRGGGHVAIRNSSLDHTRFPYSEAFPGFDEIARQEIPTVSEMRAPFEAAGFEPVACEKIEQEMAPDWAALAEKAALRADSLLARLPDAAFKQGMAALRRRRSQPGPVRVTLDLVVMRRP